jgi:hypothetical protein
MPKPTPAEARLLSFFRVFAPGNFDSLHIKAYRRAVRLPLLVDEKHAERITRVLHRLANPTARVWP